MTYCISPDSLDWSPIIPKLKRVLDGSSAYVRPDLWHAVAVYGTVFSGFSGKCAIQQILYCYSSAMYADDAAEIMENGTGSIIDIYAPQVLKFFDDFNPVMPRPPHMTFHNTYYFQPPTPDNFWNGRYVYQFPAPEALTLIPIINSIGVERPLWLKMMASTHERHVHYRHSNTAWHWEVLRHHMDIVKGSGLVPFGLLPGFHATPFYVSSELAKLHRPIDAVPKSHGIGFHLIETNNKRQGNRQRELDLIMFPYLKKYVPGLLAFDLYELDPSVEREWAWEDENSEKGLRNVPLDIDILFVAFNPVNWTATGAVDFFKCLGLK